MFTQRPNRNRERRWDAAAGAAPDGDGVTFDRDGALFTEKIAKFGTKIKVKWPVKYGRKTF
jgi:hypothetical protein